MKCTSKPSNILLILYSVGNYFLSQIEDNKNKYLKAPTKNDVNINFSEQLGLLKNT